MAKEPDDHFKRQPLRVGFYDIEKTIGKGNFAVVKLGRHRITKSQVAIKIIDKSRLDQSNITKVRREVEIMKFLRHQHVLKLYQVMETSNMMYIVTEYASNGEMFAHIDKTGRLSEEEARRIFCQILSAVDYCHQRHVVHRDIKTENLLLDENMNLKIADFGFGNFFKDNEHLKSWCGSPPYAAPEIFEGKEYFGPEVDLWSLGVVLYVLVCAALPFDGTSFAEVRDHVLSGRFRVPYFMSSELEDLIKKILVKNPAQRYTIQQIKEHPWMQKGPGQNTEILRNQTLHANFDKGIDGELNSQIISLMQGLKIDIEKTKKSVKENLYDHHSAIYYLLADRLKQHRSSYPEQRRYGTRLRRASVMADQVIIQNGMVQSLVQSSTPQMMQPIPRQVPITPLQYALTDLHIGDVPIPTDMQPQVPGCSSELLTHSLSASPHHMSYASPSFLASGQTPTIQEDVAGENGDEPTRGNEYATLPVEQNKRRVRRMGILPTFDQQPKQETLFVPANHPLLKVNNDRDESAQMEMGHETDGYSLPNGMRIQIIPPTEQLSNSLATVVRPQRTDTKLKRLCPISYPAFSEGRRASEGNPSNAPFRQLLHKVEVNAVHNEQHELLKLQQSHQRSLTPEQIYQQHLDHVAYHDLYKQEELRQHQQMPFELYPKPEEMQLQQQFQQQQLQQQQTIGLPISGNNLTTAIQSTLNRSSDDFEDSEMMNLNSGVPGPFRRQHPCRKHSNSPINVLPSRGSFRRQRKQSIIMHRDNINVQSNQEDFIM
eukprot:gene16957-8455_t